MRIPRIIWFSLALFTSAEALAGVDFTEKDVALVKKACLAGDGIEFITEADGSLSIKNLEGKGKLHVKGGNITYVDVPDADKRAEFADIRQCIMNYLLRDSGRGTKKVNDLPAKYPETAINRVNSFQFVTSPNETAPGLRRWKRVAPDMWEEKYPDGTKHYSYIVGRIRLADCDGTVVSGKFDKDFQAFFPDRNCPAKEFLFRRLSQGNQWHSYVQITDMK